MKPRKRINPISERQKERLKEYAKVKNYFLWSLEHSYCPVAREIEGKRRKITDVHHMRGRIGSLLCDVRYFLAVSRWGHVWIENHPEEARKHGWLCAKGDWNRP